MSTTIRSAAAVDVPGIEALLRSNGLPDAGVAERLETTLVAIENGTLVGTSALELFADGALLRSLAVTADRRSGGVGTLLVRAALAIASRSAPGDVYLLTTTADRYFPRFGFARVGREDVPAGVGSSDEFVSACPASAVIMRLRRGAHP